MGAIDIDIDTDTDVDVDSRLLELSVPSQHDGRTTGEPAPLLSLEKCSWRALQVSAAHRALAIEGTSVDYDGDGKADPAIYKPSVRFWEWLRLSTSYTQVQKVQDALSVPTDVAVPGDHD